MTPLKKIISAVVIGSGIVATVGSAAEARDWNGRDWNGRDWNGRGGYHQSYGRPAPRYHAPRPQPHYGYHQPRRDRTGEKIAKGVAIGVGALILGSILANEARRHRHYDGY